MPTKNLKIAMAINGSLSVSLDYSESCPMEEPVIRLSDEPMDFDLQINDNSIFNLHEKEFNSVLSRVDYQSFLYKIAKQYAELLIEKKQKSINPFDAYSLTENMCKDEALKLMPCKNGYNRCPAICDNCPVNPNRDLSYDERNYDENGNFNNF